MEGSSPLIALVPALPLLGAAINGALGIARKPLPRTAAGGLASAVMLAAAGVSFTLLAQLMGGGHGEGHGAALTQTLWTWMKTGPVSVDVAFSVDPLTAVMMCVVTGIGSLIHIYSIGYMDDDADKDSVWRFFAYLNLFAFSMLCLIMGDNFAMMFVGWEGVGLCSYLLIGFWFKNSDYASAGKKAFVTNRVGDFLFLCGLFWLFWTVSGRTDANVMNFAALAEVVQKDPMIVGGAGGLTVTGICLLMFGGATGKSAQIPLYVWLPDAMAGPTPVSALIHAATMVTAGIYMICRLNFLFILAPAAMAVVATIGVLTAFFAASIAITQNDIKKVLAYSTVSQLGFMFLGVGVGSFVGGFFHVITHAFFKALMFLGAGSIIHALHHEQDMRHMGGLRKYMPVTFATFTCGWLAIIGFPGTSGFFSKDEILWLTFTTELYKDLPLGTVMPKVLWAIGFVTALMTAFYMTRLMCMTFFGKYRGGHHGHGDHGAHGDAHGAHGGHGDAHGHGHDPHESPAVLVGPLVVLAALSIVGGAMNLPHWIAEHGWLHHFLSPVFAGSEELAKFDSHSPLEFPLMGLTLVGVMASVGAAWFLYVSHPERPAQIAERIKPLYVGSLNKWFVDEIYGFTLLAPLYLVSRQVLWAVVDAMVIDGAVNGAAAAVGAVARGHGRAGGGRIQIYAIAIAAGAALVALAYALS